MKKVNTYFFCSLGESLKLLTEYDGETKFSWKVVGSLMRTRALLEKFIEGRDISFKTSISSAREVLNNISAVLPDTADLFGKDENKVDGSPLEYKGYRIGESAKTFLTVLAAELEGANTYFVSRKGIFDTTDLIESAENTFSEQIRRKLTERVIHDIQQSGRALAFELPTACGFHLMRALESVMIVYYKHLTAKELIGKPSDRNWGNYISKLKDAKASESVLYVLDHIRTLHRNPIMHPEDILSLDEAKTLWGIVDSAITAMYNDMEQIRKTIPPADSDAVSAAA